MVHRNTARTTRHEPMRASTVSSTVQQQQRLRAGSLARKQRARGRAGGRCGVTCSSGDGEKDWLIKRCTTASLCAADIRILFCRRAQHAERRGGSGSGVARDQARAAQHARRPAPALPRPHAAWRRCPQWAATVGRRGGGPADGATQPVGQSARAFRARGEAAREHAAARPQGERGGPRTHLDMLDDLREGVRRARRELRRLQDGRVADVHGQDDDLVRVLGRRRRRPVRRLLAAGFAWRVPALLLSLRLARRRRLGPAVRHSAHQRNTRAHQVWGVYWC